MDVYGDDKGTEKRRIIKQYEQVVIKPGRYAALSEDQFSADEEFKGTVVEVLGDQDMFLVDIGSSPADWDTIDVQRDDIIG